MSQPVALDFGSSFTRLWVKEKDREREKRNILRLPTVLAVKNGEDILAFGADARQMIGRTPYNIRTLQPVRRGEVADLDAASAFLSACFDKAGAVSLFSHPHVVAAMQFGAGEAARRALISSILEAGASGVSLVDAPLASAIGARMKINNDRGMMLVDIGAGATRAAVICHGGVVACATLPLGGDALDEAIIRYLNDRRQILVGASTAEALKRKLGTLTPVENNTLGVRVTGKNTRMGGAASVLVVPGELRDAMSPVVDKMIEAVHGVLEKIPSQLCTEVSDFGLVLSGGTALLPGIGPYISSTLGFRVAISPSPREDTVAGLCAIADGGRRMSKYITYRQ